jgi:peptidoglycan/xylan/chitin deacetylase (PgdA/CDA1 family)
MLAADSGAALPVLMYHHIGSGVMGTNPALTISPAEFERHLHYLKRRGYTTILPADWLAYVTQGKALPRKPLLLTFDDAYADLAQHCFPLLKKYGCTGVVFVPTANIAGTNVWDQPDWPVPHRLLSAGQIAEWAAQGIDFGAHTRSHPDLRYLTLSEVDKELEGSRRDLETILGRQVVSFAYPYGYCGDREVELALCKFPLCFTTNEGKNTLATDLGRLRRIMIYPGGLLGFRLCLVFGFDPIIRLRTLVRLRTRLRRFWRTLSGADERTN